jgi:hypothetical protein
MTVKLQARDRELMSALSSQVNVLSFEQVARGWWGRTEDPKGTVSRRLRTLARDSHVHVFEVVTGPEVEFTSPLVEWAPGEAPKNTGALTEAVERRSRAATGMRRLVATSRAKAALLAEGPPELATHELNLSALYLHLRPELDGWKVVSGSADPKFSAAIDASGRRFEVASRPLLGKLDALARACRAGGSVW